MDMNNIDMSEALQMRQRAIDTIENLFPPDSGYDPNPGKEIMIEALAINWRTLPTDVLETMARLNIARDSGG